MAGNLWNELNSVFRTVFGDPSLTVGPATTAASVDGWDSLSRVNLILAIETHFRIKFAQKEILRFRSVGDLAECIQSKLG